MWILQHAIIEIIITRLIHCHIKGYNEKKKSVYQMNFSWGWAVSSHQFNHVLTLKIIQKNLSHIINIYPFEMVFFMLPFCKKHPSVKTGTCYFVLRNFTVLLENAVIHWMVFAFHNTLYDVIWHSNVPGHVHDKLHGQNIFQTTIICIESLWFKLLRDHVGADFQWFLCHCCVIFTPILRN